MGVVLTPDGCMHQAEIAELSGAPEEGVTMEVATLFVYGTLMRGECRFSILEHDCGLEALCEGAVRGRLLSLGAYPGVVALSTAKSWVHGEFCMLREPNKAFKVLDEVEDFLGWNDPSSMYERVLAKVRMPDGSTPLAWTYRLAIPWKLLPEISGGDWRRRAR